MTAATRLLEKKREMLELEQVTKVDEVFLSQEIVNIIIQRKLIINICNPSFQALSAQKEAFQMKMASLNSRREELDKKELSLRGSLMKFNQFLIETDIKKQRAEKKANNERQEKEQKVEEAEAKMAERGKMIHFYQTCICIFCSFIRQF